jgi:DNA-binding NarL/FixJ family response regulator
MGETMKRRIRLLIADDRPSSRKGLRALLGVRPEIEIVGDAVDGREAVRLVEELQPDVVLMDVSMPVLDGLEATRLIKNQWPEVRVIILTMYALSPADAQAVGADASLVKGCPTENLLRAIWAKTGSTQATSSQQEPPEKGKEGTEGTTLPVTRAWCTP